jgi:heme exporter protein B
LSARPIGFLRATSVLAAKDLRLEWRTWDTLVGSVVFSVVVLVVFAFTMGLGVSTDPALRRLVPGVLWTTLVFASVIGTTRSMQLERHHHSLAALCLAPIDRSAIFAGKLVGNLAKLTVLEVALLPLVAVLFDVDLGSSWLALLLVLVLHGIGIAALGTLFAAVTTRLGRGEALLTTLLLPAITPLLLSAVRTTAAVLEAQPLSEVGHWLLLSAGFDLLYLFVGALAFELALEA